MIFTDPDGKKVRALNEEAKEVIRFTLTPEEAKYVRYNKQGLIDATYLSRGTKELSKVGDNYKALLSLAKSDDVYEASVASHYDIIKKGGKRETKHFDTKYVSDANEEWDYVYKEQYTARGKTRQDFDKEHPEFNKSPEASGLAGKSFFVNSPERDGSSSATGTNIVLVSSLLTGIDKAKTMAHELYGHTFFQSIGKAFEHNNKELEQQVANRSKEAGINYKKHKK